MNPLVIEAAKQATRYAAIPAGIALVAGTHTIAYKIGEAKGRKKGEKIGYRKASEAYEAKYQELKDKFEKKFSFL